MFSSLPETTQEFKDWPWTKIEPYYQELQERELNADTQEAWLKDWSHLAELISETYQRLYVAITVDTTDQESEQKYNTFVDKIFPNVQAAEQVLKKKLLASGLQPEGFEIPLRNMRLEADLFRQENLPLLSEEMKLNTEYDKIIGAQTVEWEGQELTILQVQPIFQELDRAKRESAWRLASSRQLVDRQAINALWGKLLAVRTQLAANAGRPDYRAFRWQQMLRFDYTPSDAVRFHEAIEKVVVPAAKRMYEKRRQQLGLETLRPWDLDADTSGKPPLRPFQQVDELKSKVSAMFHRVDPQLGAYFDEMRRDHLLDLENRKGKAPGGYCTSFTRERRPFIFMNAVSTHDDVQTLLHEGGHAFHCFETAHLPYYQQLELGLEFAEVASMGMELLSAPYLEAKEGGFYSEAEAARARIEHLEGIVRFWPYMAVVDAFQHWVYTHPQQAQDPDQCDAQWGALWDRFMVGVDWSGLEAEKVTGWHRKLHIHQVPFYYIEYGLAQMGAMQVWRNALRDQAEAVAAYRRALSLGGTVTLPELYQTAGARLAFDSGTLQELVDLAEETIARLESKAEA